jgi:hypothetical protein
LSWARRSSRLKKHICASGLTHLGCAILALMLFKPAVLKQNRQEEEDNAHNQHKKTVSANQVELEWVLVAGK